MSKVRDSVCAHSLYAVELSESTLELGEHPGCDKLKVSCGLGRWRFSESPRQLTTLAIFSQSARLIKSDIQSMKLDASADVPALGCQQLPKATVVFNHVHRPNHCCPQVTRCICQQQLDARVLCDCSRTV